MASGRRRCEVLGTEDPQHLGVTFPARPQVPVQLHETGGPLDRLLLRPYLVQGVADHLLRLGERPVGDGEPAIGQPYPGTGGARGEPGGVEQRTRLGSLVAKLHDRFHQLGRWWRGRLGRPEQHEVSHSSTYLPARRYSCTASAEIQPQTMMTAATKARLL